MKVDLKNKKKNRIIISSIEELKEALNIEGKSFENILDDKIEECFKKENIKFKVIDTEDFYDYVYKVKEFNKKKEELKKLLHKINVLKIQRVEFDRDQRNNKALDYKEDEYLEQIAAKVFSEISEEDKHELESLEIKIKDKYLYSKDVELLKKIICYKNENVIEDYDNDKSIKTIRVILNKEIDFSFVKGDVGSVEYHKFLDNNVDRIGRILKNLDKYLIEEFEGTFILNQSNTLQDSINIAIAYFNDEKFKAVSGKNDLKNSVKVIPREEAAFESFKVNRLGQIGYGYERINDSEKKILEYIHQQIKDKNLKDTGYLMLITKWEPCPSCYLVIEQFMKVHPKINVEVKYMKRYGEY